MRRRQRSGFPGNILDWSRKPPGTYLAPLAWASQQANMWGNIAIGVGIVVNILVVVGQILIAAAARQGQPGF